MILAQHAHANFDEGAAHLGLIKSQGTVVGLELFHGTHNAGTSGGDDLRAFVLEVIGAWIDAVEPRAVVVVSLVLEGGHDPRPVEASAPIESLAGIG